MQISHFFFRTYFKNKIRKKERQYFFNKVDDVEIQIIFNAEKRAKFSHRFPNGLS